MSSTCFKTSFSLFKRRTSSLRFSIVFLKVFSSIWWLDSTSFKILSLTVSLSIRGTILFSNLLYFFLLSYNSSSNFCSTSRYLLSTLSLSIYYSSSFRFNILISFLASSRAILCLLITCACVCKSSSLMKWYSLDSRCWCFEPLFCWCFCRFRV